MCIDKCWESQLQYIVQKQISIYAVTLMVHIVHFTILNETRFVANNPLHLLIAQSDVNVIQLQFNKQLLRTHVPST